MSDVRVEVAASSANLGPGYDSFGLAIDWVDTVTFAHHDHDVAVVTGEAAGDIPTDGRHLIIATARTALADLGVDTAGIRVETHNTIPHGRGLGSSAAAVAAGVLGAWGLARPGEPVDAGWAFDLCTRVEGHPDNVGAVLFGGFIVAWVDDHARLVRIPVHPHVRIRSYVPITFCATSSARAVLPAEVAHATAAANSARAGLLVHALSRDPALLFVGTRDFLHQEYRAQLMPDAAALLADLRAEGHAAVISGAGPTVLVLSPAERLPALPDQVEGFAVADHGVGPGARVNGELLSVDMTRDGEGATVFSN